ncbi:MAG: glyoxalase [Klenkia sp.]|nr:glyoxalase [Klenkia sp.]
MTVALSFSSLLVADPDRSVGFYADVFDLPEVASLASPHFRGLRLGPTVLGFSGPKAYELLRLPEPAPDAIGVDTFLTFEAASIDEVDVLTAAAADRGATVLSAPSETYYGAWQAVLADPDGHVFRINHLALDD